MPAIIGGIGAAAAGSASGAAVGGGLLGAGAGAGAAAGGMSGWLGPAIGAASSILGFSGASSTNKAQIEAAREMQQFGAQVSVMEAQKNRDFQERMRRSQYQTAVQDMMDAGLNPMLAYQQGGAGTPSGSTATASGGAAPVLRNPTEAGFQSAAQAAAIRESASRMELQDSQKLLAENTAKRELSSAGQLEAETDRIRTQLKKFEDEWEKLKYEVITTRYGAFKAGAERTIAEEYQLRGRRGEPISGIAYPEFVQMLEHARELSQKADLYNLEVPRAVNEAKAQSSWWMRNVSPYMPDFLKGATGLRLLK